MAVMIPGLIPTILRDTRCRRLVRSGAVCLCAMIVQPQELNAQAFLEDMELIGIGGNAVDGGAVAAQSSIAAQFRSQTGGLSDGSRYSFNRYYSTDFEDLRVTMMSPMTDNFGIIWGFGTGESGNKYQIDPSLKFGFTEPSAAFISELSHGGFNPASCRNLGLSRGSAPKRSGHCIASLPASVLKEKRPGMSRLFVGSIQFTSLWNEGRRECAR